MALPDVPLERHDLREQVRDDLFITDSFPVEIDEQLQEQIGSVRSQDIQRSDLFIVARSQSSRPLVLDDLSKALRDAVAHEYRGLRLSGWNVSLGQPAVLGGGIEQDGKMFIQQLHWWLHTIQTPGSPRDALGPGRLANAASLSEPIARLINAHPRYHRRVNRALQEFLAGSTERIVEERLHRFARAIEGFILPETGATRQRFASRTELFVGKGHHHIMHEIFDLRSAAEHLNDHRPVLENYSDQERSRIYLIRTMQAEAVARYCLATFLSRPVLWTHFSYDDPMRAFWQLDQGRQREIWGDPIDPTTIEAQFNPDVVSQELLRVLE